MTRVIENGKSTDILYSSNGKSFYRDKSGRIRSIPINRFHHGQIVRSTEKHFTNEDFVMLKNPAWTQSRGWVYSKYYISIDGPGGGMSSAWNECEFEELSDAACKVYAERFYARKDTEKFSRELRDAQERLGKAEHAVSIITE